MLTQKDKIAKLQRLVKQIDEWNLLRKMLPAIARMGEPVLSFGSPEFGEWRSKVEAAIVLIFGEHSHYIDDFNEIQYTNILAHLSELGGGQNLTLWDGLEAAKRLLETMIDEIKAIDEGQQSADGMTLERTNVIKQPEDMPMFPDITPSKITRSMMYVIEEDDIK